MTKQQLKLLQKSIDNIHFQAIKDNVERTANIEWARKKEVIVIPKVVLPPKPKFNWLKQLRVIVP